MSTTPPAATPAPMPGRPSGPGQPSKMSAILGYLIRGRKRPGEVTIISHSDLFYWWPVWLIGFIMCLLTWIHGVHAGFIRGQPEVIKIEDPVTYTKVAEAKEGNTKSYTEKVGEAIIADSPKGTEPFPTSTHGGHDTHIWPLIHNSKNLGVVFCITLLLVIVITNVHLRGLWSLIVILLIVLAVVVFALAGWWDEILTRGSQLAIYLNMGAYFSFSAALFAIWVVNFAFFDRQRYVSVTSGQVRLHLAIGEGETVYDTMGMVFQKQRSDLFRHWILGFGSGDLVIRPSNVRDAIDMPNVLFVGHKVQEIQDLIKEKEVVSR